MIKDWFRFWLHFPVGAICSILVATLEWQGIMLSSIFVAYEILNDWRKEDNSYKDVFGFAFGFGVMALSLLIYPTWLEIALIYLWRSTILFTPY